ncbi:MAG: hypothetical protein Q9179_000751 [Wetmoreana sp. 5 TL-2023]
MFCGSDEFSIESLQALNQEKRTKTGSIASIAVVCRPEKPVQRNLTAVREVPIAAVARRLGLPLYQIDTFTKWTPSIPPNLVVAVSFGLLIPPRIIQSAKYGGLNVHPSMLPEFPGPAPLHHTLLEGRKTTGVTLQTLHPTKFDGGKIIAQTPYPGIEHGAETVGQLRDVTAPLGARMLVQGIKNGLFIPPVQEVGWYTGDEGALKFTYASKIGPKDRHINWASWSASDILRRQRIIGPLWNYAESFAKEQHGSRKIVKRVIWEHGFRLLEHECHLFPATGHPVIVGLHGITQKVYIRTCDGNVLVADMIKVEGGTTTEAFHAARRTGLAPIPTTLDNLARLPHDFVAFHARLA